MNSGDNACTAEPPERWFDSDRRLLLTRRGVWLAVGVLALFIPVDLFVTGYIAHAVAEAIGLAALLLVSWMLTSRRGLAQAQWVATLIVGSVILVVVATGAAADGVIIWLAVFPPIPFFAFGARRGLIVSVLFSALVLGLLATQVLVENGGGQSWLALVNAGGALAASITLAFLYEQSRADAARRLYAAASSDQLTGVRNRRGFLEGFECRRALVLRRRQVMSLLVFDIDYLKRINDDHGHAVGDAAICHVAQLVRERVRDQDLLGRLGGDEFALLLPDTPLDGALKLAAELRTALREQPLPCAHGMLSITLSIGAAQAPPGPIDLDALFAAADRQLYAAKNGGRDLHLGAMA